jgi:hypothetical protein
MKRPWKTMFIVAGFLGQAFGLPVAAMQLDAQGTFQTDDATASGTWKGRFFTDGPQVKGATDTRRVTWSEAG